MDDIITQQREIYRDRYTEVGDLPEGFHWRDEKTRDLRFSRLIRHLPLQSGDSIYDVGCGTGQLHQFMQDQGLAHTYIGCEIVPEMIAQAREKNPDQQFESRDIIQEPSEHSYDHVVASGVFFIRGDSDLETWSAYVSSMVYAMYAMCRRSISFNVLGDWSDWQEDRLAYLNLQELQRYCRSLTRFMVVDIAYPLYEGTITLLRPEVMKEAYSGSEFARYFPPENKIED